MRLSLVPLAFADPTIVLNRLPLVIGRGADADVTIPDQLASRLHCCLEEHEGKLLILDLGSMNGTHVNGDRVDKRTLSEGDIVRIGASSYRVASLPNSESPIRATWRRLPFLASFRLNGSRHANE